MKTILHTAESRGQGNYGWLNAKYSFSFSNYFNPERIHFGALRVINDDRVAGGMGFAEHPHNDMEIITIPLEGALRHGDNMGNNGVIGKGEIQVMSAGKGVYHSERNANAKEDVKLLQIWIFPNKKGVEPRYDQITISDNAKPNDFQQIVSPNADDEGTWIHQDAWLNIANFSQGNKKDYSLHKSGNGVYIFVIEGQAKVGEQILGKRDALGIYDTDSFTLEATEDSEILLIEVPMEF